MYLLRLFRSRVKQLASSISLVAFIAFTEQATIMTGAATKIPSTRAKLQAEAALRVMTHLPGAARPRELRLAPSEGEDVGVTIPKEAFEILLEVLGQMANGNAVAVVPVHAELTTQQAAELLNVSRPFLIGLLDSGKIPFRQVGAHRRVRLTDLTAYQEADERQRRAVLDELTSNAQKHGFGY
jgi:excisionase family DNA binding protein